MNCKFKLEITRKKALAFGKWKVIPISKKRSIIQVSKTEELRDRFLVK
jgi:hypothetical protein